MKKSYIFTALFLLSAICYGQNEKKKSTTDENWYLLPPLAEIQDNNTLVAGPWQTTNAETFINIYDRVDTSMIDFSFIRIADQDKVFRWADKTDEPSLLVKDQYGNFESKLGFTNVAFYEANNSYILSNGYKRIPPVPRGL